MKLEAVDEYLGTRNDVDSLIAAYRAAQVLNLKVTVCFTPSGPSTRYLVIEGPTPPASSHLTTPTAVWRSASLAPWCCYRDSRWDRIPAVDCQGPTFHPTHPGLRLYQHTSWDRPYWLSESGYERRCGHGKPRSSNAWAVALLEQWEADCHLGSSFNLIWAILLSFADRDMPTKHYPTLNTHGMFEQGYWNPTLERVMCTARAANDTPGIHYKRVETADGSLKNLRLSHLLSAISDPRRHVRQYFCDTLHCNRIRALGSLSEWKFTLPYCLQQHKYSLARDLADPSGSIQQNALLASPGAITALRTRRIGTGELFIHVSGSMVWLMWPPTERNLEAIGPHWVDNQIPFRDSDLAIAIYDLEDVHVLFASKPNTSFYIPPCWISAALSLSAVVELSGVVVDPDAWALAFDRLDFYIDKVIDEWTCVAEAPNATFLVEEDFATSTSFMTQLHDIVAWYHALHALDPNHEAFPRLRSITSRFLRLIVAMKAQMPADLPENMKSVLAALVEEEAK